MHNVFIFLNFADDYRLHDPQDTGRYLSEQSFKAGAMNPCINSTFDFITKVVQNIKQYHDEAGHALTLMHLAGDEVANHAWSGSPACQAMTANHTSLGTCNIDAFYETDTPPHSICLQKNAYHASSMLLKVPSQP